MSLLATRPRWVDGLLYALLVVLVTAGQRFDTARAEIETYGEQVVGGWLGTGWTVATVVGVPVAVFAAHQLIKVAGEFPSQRDSISLLPWLAYLAVAAWTVWQATGAAVVFGADIAWRTYVAVATIVLAVAAVGWAGRSVAGNAKSAWDHASVVRLQLVLLATLLAVVLALPVTADQCLDVLRAWGDGPYSRVAAGIAGALLLGVVCRASARRLLVPRACDRAYGPRRVGDWIARTVRGPLPPNARVVRLVAPWALMSLLAVAAGLAGFPTLAVGVGVMIGLLAITVWAQPIAPESIEEPGLKRLAGTLGTIPLTILLAGLTSATVDSLLLPSKATREDGTLLVYTFAVLVGVALLVANAHTARPSAAPDHPQRRVIALAGAGFAGALAPATLLGLDPALDAVSTTVLLLVAVVLASRRWVQPGPADFWVAAAIVLGSAAAIYCEPIAAARVLGAFALVFIGATGLLLVLHAAGSIGARRAFRFEVAGLPQRAPVILVLGGWIVLAFFMLPDTNHQVRTVPTKARQTPLAIEVSHWLSRQVPVVREDGASYVPMLLIAASGGGSKAAYWTDLVTDCMFGEALPRDAGPECTRAADARNRYGRLFLTSSVSGGSVGVRHLISHSETMIDGKNWVSAAAGPEALSPVVGWGFFHDLPAFVLGTELDPDRCEQGAGWACRVHADRALVQELTIADGDFDGPRDGGLLGRTGPVTVFNAAEDGATRRILASRVQLAAMPPPSGCSRRLSSEPLRTAIDAHDVFGRNVDVPLITAAMISARFPVVEPPARLGYAEAPDPGSCLAAKHLPPAVARDGGYIENSGVLTITELLPTILGAIAGSPVQVRPIVVSIDDDTVKLSETDLERGPSSAFGIGATAGPGLLTAGARAALETCSIPPVSYFRISPPRRVGAKAATGWELSDTTAREDLQDGLRVPDASTALLQIRKILRGEARPGKRCGWVYD